MTDVVTKANEEMYRRQFAAVSGHSMECIEETVEEMGKAVAFISKEFRAPVDKVLSGIEIEQFEKHLYAILDDKKCNCKK